MIFAVIAMPFVAFFSVILMVAGTMNASEANQLIPTHRIRRADRRKLRLARMLCYIAIAELFGLLLLQALAPESLNWW